MSYRLRYTVGPASRSSACIGSGSSRTSWLKGSTSLVGASIGRVSVSVMGRPFQAVSTEGPRSEVEHEAVGEGAGDADVHAVPRGAFVVVQQRVAVVGPPGQDA